MFIKIPLQTPDFGCILKKDPETGYFRGIVKMCVFTCFFHTNHCDNGEIYD